MTKLDELYEKEKRKAVEDARADEKAKYATKTVDRLLAIGNLSNEQIADVASVSLEFVLERAGQKIA